jgi:hypothetical protein
MKSKKRNIVADVATVGAGLILWHVTLYLLGSKPSAVRGVAEHVGSIIVLSGCFSLASGLINYLMRVLHPKKTEENIYDNVMTEIAAENKTEPNHPLQRNASTGSVSNFESPARRG